MIVTKRRQESQIKFRMVKKGWTMVCLVFIPQVKKSMLRPCEEYVKERIEELFSGKLSVKEVTYLFMNDYNNV